jgi:prepilin-type N-terminal cleavage/methylation domain-containing protein
MTRNTSPARPVDAVRLPGRHVGLARRAGFVRRNGFTLVELLVVIGIIVLLIAILLPVAGRVRVAAQTAATRSAISALAGAIERYHADERSYPGLFSNAELAAGKSLTYSGGSGGGAELTSSENLVGSLVGGFEASASMGTPDSAKLDASTTIGKGPMSFSPSVVARKRRPAYIEAGPGNLLPSAPYGGSGVAADHEVPGVAGGTKDSAFPEFYDAYSTPRPLIYLRANVSTAVSTSNPLCGPIATKTTTNQYSTYELNYYKRGAAGDFPGDFNWGSSADEYYKDELEYLANPVTYNASTPAASTPRGQDKYILISAGADRIFGTKDDLFYGGN